jgi:hypothetical protein
MRSSLSRIESEKKDSMLLATYMAEQNGVEQRLQSYLQFIFSVILANV